MVRVGAPIDSPRRVQAPASRRAMPALAPGRAALPLALPLLLCLALAAHALANEDACSDPELNVTADKGEVLPLPDGECGRLWCEGGARRPRFVKHVCEKAPDSSCRVEPGVKDAPYPACCDGITCAGHRVQHGKCVEPATKAIVERGSTWPLPDGECGFMECTGYVFDPRARRFTWGWRKYSCAKLEVTKPGCAHVEGVRGEVFPSCCPRVTCVVPPQTLTSESPQDSSEEDG